LPNIKRFAELNNISQAEIARKLGYSVTHINRIFTGALPSNIKFEAKFKESYPEYENFLLQSGNLANEAITAYKSDISSISELKQVPFSDFMETEYLPIEAQAGYLDSLESQELLKLETMLIPKEFEKGNYLVTKFRFHINFFLFNFNQKDYQFLYRTFYKCLNLNPSIHPHCDRNTCICGRIKGKSIF